MTAVRFWFSRAALVYAAAIFGLIAGIWFVNPQIGLERFGLSVNGTPESLAFPRTTAGALFIAMTVNALYGLARPRDFRTALIAVLVMDGSVLAARLFSIVHVGVSVRQLLELRNEAGSFLLFAAALWADPRRPA